MFYNKYIKYKNKYLQLKKQIYGGSELFDLDNNIIFESSEDNSEVEIIEIDNYTSFPSEPFYILHNRLGTCWNHTIQMILFFGDKTRLQLKTLIENKISALQIFNESKTKLEIYFGKTVKEKEIELVRLIEMFIYRHKNVHLRIEDEFCERTFMEIYKSIIGKNFVENYSGDFVDIEKMINFLCICFFGKKIKFTQVKLFDSNKINMKLVENSIGILGFTNDHVITFYNYNDYGVYCNNEFVSFYNYMDLFNKYNLNRYKYHIIINNYNKSLPTLKTDIVDTKETESILTSLLIINFIN